MIQSNAATRVRATALLLCFSSFFAHASTVPLFDQLTPWFLGFPFFQFTLVVWIITNLSLTAEWVNNTKWKLDTFVTLALALSLLLSMAFNVARGIANMEVVSYLEWVIHLLWVLLLAVYSFTDSRDITLYVSYLTLANNGDGANVEGYFHNRVPLPWFNLQLASDNPAMVLQ